MSSSQRGLLCNPGQNYNLPQTHTHHWGLHSLLILPPSHIPLLNTLYVLFFCFIYLFTDFPCQRECHIPVLLTVAHPPPSRVFSTLQSLSKECQLNEASASEKWKLATQSCSTLQSHGLWPAQFLSPWNSLEWVAISFSKGSSQPRDCPGSPALQADSLPTESLNQPETHTFIQ